MSYPGDWLNLDEFRRIAAEKQKLRYKRGEAATMMIVQDPYRLSRI